MRSQGLRKGVGSRKARRETLRVRCRGATTEGAAFERCGGGRDPLRQAQGRPVRLCSGQARVPLATPSNGNNRTRTRSRLLTIRPIEAHRQAGGGTPALQRSPSLRHMMTHATLLRQWLRRAGEGVGIGLGSPA